MHSALRALHTMSGSRALPWPAAIEFTLPSLWHRYTYYLMATLFTDPRTKRKYLWWGRYLTQFQVMRPMLCAPDVVMWD